MLLFVLSSLAKDPTSMVAIVTAAQGHTRIFSDINWRIPTPVLFHTKCIGRVMMVIGTWKKMRRSMIASQSKNGITQFLSWRCTTTLAIHQLQRVSTVISAALGNLEIFAKRTR